MKKICPILVITFLMIASISNASVTAFSNLGEALAGSAVFSSTVFEAAQFTTGDSVGGYLLSDITFLQGQAGALGDYGIVSIYDNIGGNPGSSLFDMSTVGPAPGAGNPIVVSPSSQQTLAASTIYYIVFSTTSDIGSGAAQITASDSQTIGDPAVIGNGWDLGNSTWHYDGSAWTEHDAIINVALDVTVVPEPATFLLALMGGGVLFLRKRKK